MYKKFFLDWKTRMKQSKAITRDIRNLSEHEEKDYHKPVSVATF